MLQEHEDYTTPVGFASEPAAERKRWIGRIVLVLFVLALGWMLFNRVINPQGENDRAPIYNESEDPLPGPI